MSSPTVRTEGIKNGKTSLYDKVKREYKKKNGKLYRNFVFGCIEENL